MTSNFVVVSYFTKEYANHAIRFIDSLEKFNISYDVTSFVGRSSWIANVNYKPEFCRAKLIEHDMPVVWIDCDAEVKSYPILFDTLRKDYDVGLFHRNRVGRMHELLSGTLYFNNTSMSRKILDLWVEKSRIYSTTWDQRTLQSVIEEHEQDIKIFEFPCSYVRIFDAEDMKDVNPVILHNQASRQLRKVVS